MTVGATNFSIFSSLYPAPSFFGTNPLEQPTTARKVAGVAIFLFLTLSTVGLYPCVLLVLSLLNRVRSPTPPLQPASLQDAQLAAEYLNQRPPIPGITRLQWTSERLPVCYLGVNYPGVFLGTAEERGVVLLRPTDYSRELLEEKVLRELDQLGLRRHCHMILSPMGQRHYRLEVIICHPLDIQRLAQQAQLARASAPV